MATTITVEEGTLERFKRLKAKTGNNESIPQLSSDQFVKSLLDAWEENGQSIYGQPTIEDSGEIADQLVAEMDAMAFNGQVQDEKADEIIGRIKDLHTEIQKLNERLQR